MKDNNIDCREINLKDSKHQKFLTNSIEEMIQEAVDACDTYQIYDIYDRNDLYYEGYQTPVGFTNNYLRDFVTKNWDKISGGNFLRKDENGLVYVIDNQIPRWIDGIEGQYTSVKSSVQVIKDDDYRNDNIEKVIQKLYDKYENDKQNWYSVITPGIRKTLRRGLSWYRDIINPNRNLEYGGEIMSSTIDPRDVLFDPNYKSPFLKDTRYRIWRHTIPRAQAVEYLSQFGIKEDEVIADGNTDLKHVSSFRWKKMSYQNDQFVNIYFAEWRKVYRDKYTRKSSFEMYGGQHIEGVEERDYFFHSVYTKANGVLAHHINKNTFAKQDYDKFYLTPLVNKISEVRPFPISHIEELANLQDIINITETLILDNARQRQKIRMFVAKEIYDKYGDTYVNNVLTKKGLLSDWFEKGGALPVMREDIAKSVVPFEMPDLPRQVYEFLDIAKKSFQEQGDTQSALVGDYPEYEMSGKAIQSLEAQKRKKMGYFDININYAITNRAKKIYNIFVNEWNAEMIIKNQGAKPGDPKGIHVNAIMSFPEYEQHLIDLGLVDDQAKMMLEMISPDDPEYIGKRRAVLEPAMKKDAEHNEIFFVMKPGTMSVSDTGQLVPSNGMAMYEQGLVFINQLSTDDYIDIKVTLDFDKERDKEIEKQIALQLEAAGKLPLEILFDMLGGTFADRKADIMQKLSEQQIGMMLAEEIAARPPDFQQLIMSVIQQYDAAAMQQGQAQASQGSGKPRTQPAKAR